MWLSFFFPHFLLGSFIMCCTSKKERKCIRWAFDDIQYTHKRILVIPKARPPLQFTVETNNRAINPRSLTQAHTSISCTQIPSFSLWFSHFLMFDFLSGLHYIFQKCFFLSLAITVLFCNGRKNHKYTPDREKDRITQHNCCMCVYVYTCACVCGCYTPVYPNSC